ncbi:MAG TPA: VOC family protein [Armatimonadota bacterium]|nr:VOC family protein [Armatimonadota bacterium]
MNLNHLNLTVTSPAETSRFLQKYFGMRPLGEPPADNASMAFVTDDNGMVLSLLRGKRGVEIVYPPAFHVGFIQPSEERVNEIHQRLLADGFDVPPPDRLHGSWTFYFQAPGGFTIEVLA